MVGIYHISREKKSDGMEWDGMGMVYGIIYESQDLGILALATTWRLMGSHRVAQHPPINHWFVVVCMCIYIYVYNI